MRAEQIAEILEAYKSGGIDLATALANFKDWPLNDLGFAQLDSQRELRTGFPEVVYAAGKSPAQVREILAQQLGKNRNLLATRASEEHFAALGGLDASFTWNPLARTISLRRDPPPPATSPCVAVVCAGTSDLPVAEEAAVTATVFGSRVIRVSDVGVAGLHRLLAALPAIRQASVIIAVAGMEGALPSVLGGLVSRQIIAVPTSVGYGASFGGLAALLTMLNSCAAGISVVNIDNGFGAGYLAAMVIRTLSQAQA